MVLIASKKLICDLLSCVVDSGDIVAFGVSRKLPNNSALTPKITAFSKASNHSGHERELKAQAQ